MVPLALLLVAGCMPEKEPPAVELDLTDDGSTTAAAEYHRTQIRLRELPPSVGYPHGLMVASFQLRRHSGVRAEVMLEVPVQVDASSAQPRRAIRSTRWGARCSSLPGSRVASSCPGTLAVRARPVASSCCSPTPAPTACWTRTTISNGG